MDAFNVSLSAFACLLCSHSLQLHCLTNVHHRLLSCISHLMQPFEFVFTKRFPFPKSKVVFYTTESDVMLEYPALKTLYAALG